MNIMAQQELLLVLQASQDVALLLRTSSGGLWESCGSLTMLPLHALKIYSKSQETSQVLSISPHLFSADAARFAALEVLSDSAFIIE